MTNWTQCDIPKRSTTLGPRVYSGQVWGWRRHCPKEINTIVVTWQSVSCAGSHMARHNFCNDYRGVILNIWGGGGGGGRVCSGTVEPL